MDGRLVRGHGFSAGLIGDISPHGTDSGTLDTLAGGHSVLLRLFGDTIDFSATPANELAEMLLTAIDRANRGEKAAMKASAEAGRVLGKALVPFIGLLRPEAFVIAGPMAAASDYVAACGKAVLEQAPAFAARMLVSDMSAQAAARWVAIGEFLMERDLNLEELKTSRAA